MLTHVAHCDSASPPHPPLPKKAANTLSNIHQRQALPLHLGGREEVRMSICLFFLAGINGTYTYVQLTVH